MNELFDALLDMTSRGRHSQDQSHRALRCPPARAHRDHLRRRGAQEGAQALRVVGSDAWGVERPDLLERILLNLVSNAVRYTERAA